MSESYRTPAAPLRAIVEELVHAGVRDVVICPGSRSTPLALALRASSELRCWVHLDERSGAFFALGAAKGSRRPTAILGTSGTAVVNFAPAVVEARQGRVPLILLTADRPPELQDRGASQTIDQSHLYGRFAKWYAELPVPQPGAVLEAHARAVVGRAVATAAAAPAGPVQLNLPFREPLLPDGPLATPSESGTAPYAETVSGVDRVSGPELGWLAERIAAAECGLIVCGPLDSPGLPDAVVRLAEATGWAVLADPLSDVRVGRHDRSRVIAHYDLLLRSEHFREHHRPDLVLRFGAAPTSKALLQALGAWSVRQVVVDDGGWIEPTLSPSTMVQAEPVGFAEALLSALGSGRADASWSASWRVADDAARDALAQWRESIDEPFEGSLFGQLDAVVPDGSIVFAGNSMPIRDLDTFLPASGSDIRCLGNRGANGIDGMVSTALGVAAAQEGPVLAVVGDISLIHDLNALVAAARLGIDVTIVVIHNDGGGIFSLMPQAAAERPELGLPAHFEELFGTPHGLELGPLVKALGAEHEAVGHAELAAAVSASLRRPGLRVLELQTDRMRNAELHREAESAVADAVEQGR